MMKKILLAGFVVGSLTSAHPYPDPALVPQDEPSAFAAAPDPGADTEVEQGLECIRLGVEWHSDETYTLAHVVRERSGTEALAKRAKRRDPLGSYHAELWDTDKGEAVLFAAIGTGAEFRKLTRELSFRFPVFAKPLELRVFAESPSSGRSEEVLRRVIDPARAELARAAAANVEVRHLVSATRSPALKVTIYADGYTAGRADKFWSDARKVAQALVQRHFPGAEHFELAGVFAPSAKRLGAPGSLGTPVRARDSFLGLFYPYWTSPQASRIVYPTSEERYRRALAAAAYDYPLVVIDSDRYWGVGNFNEITAVPSDNSSFNYLLFHEMRHFFGLNEEYEGGGTELLFARGVEDPWSQNMSFTATREELKWRDLVQSGLPLPTPRAYWRNIDSVGAYRGGYASESSRSFKPGFGCVMERDRSFCPVCRGAIEAKVSFDLGETR